MNAVSRLKVYDSLQNAGLLPIFTLKDMQTAQKIITVCAEAGATCLEITNRGPGITNLFADLIKFCHKELPNVILGIGTVLDAPTAAQFINMGAGFIISPILDRETALLCNRRKVAYMPGCGSVDEIQQAHELGVEMCKLFPADAIGGPSFLKAVKGPIPWLSALATGGIEPSKESLDPWFKAGVTCVGMGSKLLTAEIKHNQDWPKLGQNIKQTLALIKEIKA